MQRRTFAAVALLGATALLATACSREPELPTINEVINSNSSFSTLAAGLQAGELDGSLNRGGPYTVFAPRNSAFAALPAGTLDTLLLPENKAQLVAVLGAHVVEGSYPAADLVNQTTQLTSLDGTTMSVDGFDGVKITGGAGGVVTVVQPDINARNGIIHVIDGILLP